MGYDEDAAYEYTQKIEKALVEREAEVLLLSLPSGHRVWDGLLPARKSAWRKKARESLKQAKVLE